MGHFNDWFNRFEYSDTYKKLKDNPVAYFCMEYATPQNLPIYAGGLGVLAGDYVIEAKEQNFPMIAVGLFYSKKCQINVHEDTSITNDPINLGLKPVVDKLGNRIKVTVPIKGRNINIQGWLYDEGTIPIYLLDTNLYENDPSDYKISDTLYVTDHDLRVKQEMILGIGGIRFLSKMGIKPSIYHMNEGHSAFLSYEISNVIRNENGISFSDAFETAKKHIAFTNHTLVLGGHDVFDQDFVTDLLTSYANEINIPIEELVEKGLDPKNDDKFSTTHLALRAATKVNAVSKLHAEMAKNAWPESPMIPITNGINIKRWGKIEKTEEINKLHLENKRRLLDRVRRETGVRWADTDLVVGWARRIASYKRPICFFDDLERAKELLSYDKRPIRLIYAGYSHYFDQEAHWLLNRLRDLAKGELRGSMVYLEGYSTKLSEIMIAGCDIWLNTPYVGLEACGTSGMKAALNGTLPCSTNDGWVPEIDLNKTGFLLDSDNINASLMETFGDQVTPLYYNEEYLNNKKWTDKMVASRNTILENFGTDRMLKDYIEQIYSPIASST